MRRRNLLVGVFLVAAIAAAVLVLAPRSPSPGPDPEEATPAPREEGPQGVLLSAPPPDLARRAAAPRAVDPVSAGSGSPVVSSGDEAAIAVESAEASGPLVVEIPLPPDDGARVRRVVLRAQGADDASPRLLELLADAAGRQAQVLQWGSSVSVANRSFLVPDPVVTLPDGAFEVTLKDVPLGRWLLRGQTAAERAAGTPGESPSTYEDRYIPTFVLHLDSRGTRVRLSLAAGGSMGTLRTGARGAGRPDGARLMVLCGGVLWSEFTGPDVFGGPSGDAFPEVRVPADEDLLVVLSGVPGVPKGAPLREAVRVRAGGRETVLIDVPPTVGVRVRVGRDGQDVPAEDLRGHVWREESGAEPVSLGDVPFVRGAPGEFVLSVVPGRYVVSVAAKGFAGVGSARFDVVPPGPVDVTLALESRGTHLRLVLRNADGRPAAGEALWLGRILAPDPEGAWTTLVTANAAGAVEVGPIPAGPCEVAPYSRGLIRSIEIPDQAFAEMILVLPAAVPEGPRGRVVGRVVGRSGRPPPGGHVVLIGRGEEWGRYGPLSDSFAFDGVPAGDYMLSIPRSLYRDATYLPAISVPARVEGGATTRVRIPVPDQ